MLEGMEHRVMLRAPANQVPPALAPAARETEHGEVVRLRAAAGEDELVRLRAEQLREVIARIIDRRARDAPGGMDAGSVAEVLLEIRRHRRARGRAERRGCVVIEVDH